MATTKTTMRAVQVPFAGGPFEVVERPLPEPQAGQVRIKQVRFRAMLLPEQA